MNKTEFKKAAGTFAGAFVSMVDAWLDGGEVEHVAPQAGAAALAGTTPAATRGRAKKEKAAAPAAPVETEAKEEKDSFSISDLKNEPAAGEDDFADFEEVTKTEEKEIDEATLRNKLVEFAKAKSKEKAYEILAGFHGAKKIQDLKTTEYGKVYSTLIAAM